MILRLGAIAIVLACAGRAQSEVDELKARIAVLERQLARVEERLAQIQGPTVTVATPPAAQKKDEPLPARLTVQQNETSVARVNNVPIDPALKGFFRLPGTETVIQLGGYVKTDFMYDLRYAGNPDIFQPSSFPVVAPYNSASTNFSIRQTRLIEELRRNVRGQPLRFYVESDFFGVNNTSFRLRHVYGQWNNFLVGQTWSLINDLDTSPDSLEFNGPVGMLIGRKPQFRYTRPLGGGRSLAISAERPAADVQTTIADTAITATSLMPDFVVHFRRDSELGHWQAGAIFRSVGGFAADTGTKHVLGIGLSVSALIHVTGKDNFAFQATAGRGILNLILDQQGQQLDAGINGKREVAATPAGGFQVNYQHYWWSKWRSSAAYSYSRANNLASQPATGYHASHYMLGNLLWSPADQPLTIGAEFIYGWLVRKDLSSYSAPRIQVSAQYSFFK